MQVYFISLEEKSSMWYLSYSTVSSSIIFTSFFSSFWLFQYFDNKFYLYTWGFFFSSLLKSNNKGQKRNLGTVFWSLQGLVSWHSSLWTLFQVLTPPLPNCLLANEQGKAIDSMFQVLEPLPPTADREEAPDSYQPGLLLIATAV